MKQILKRYKEKTKEVWGKNKRGIKQKQKWEMLRFFTSTTFAVVSYLFSRCLIPLL